MPLPPAKNSEEGKVMCTKKARTLFVNNFATCLVTLVVLVSLGGCSGGNTVAFIVIAMLLYKSRLLLLLLCIVIVVVAPSLV